MAEPVTKSFSDLVSDQVAVIQGNATRANLDFSAGSVLRALVEAWAAVCLWLQALVIRVLARTRLATSSGVDADSFVADFGLVRLDAGNASGDVMFSRATTTAAATVPVGAFVKSADGAWTYAVAADATRAAWTGGGYTIPAGVASLAVPVTATAGGAGGNAAPGTVTLIASAIPGVDTVTNAAAMTGGSDAETDAALRARFVAYLSSLSRATPSAVAYAISQVQDGLFWKIVEQQAPDGSVALGSFCVVLDDGSGSPSASLLSSVGTAIEAVRPLGVTFSVLAPTVIGVNVSAILGISATATRGLELAAARAAVIAYLNGIAIGEPLIYTRLALVIYAASPNITSVSALTANGATADIFSTGRQVIRAGVVTLS